MPDALRIPPEALENVHALFKLPSATRKDLLETLGGAPRFASISSLVPIVRDALGISNDHAGRLLLAVLSAVTQVEPPDWPIKRVAEEIVKAEDLGIDEVERDSETRFLKDLMELPAMLTSAKASDLLTEYDRIFGDARIVTDIRPVFLEDPGEMADGAVIVSTLKIQYQDSHGLGSFYVSLDTHDLTVLKKVVDRALSKIDTVKERLDRAELAYYVEESTDEAS
ncbi:MAG TPA: hypothetical protein VFJ57_11385 [Solirubrobacterales bacterium]|nr:hypothetical protein [Solirubrobacterales bacterium]